LTHTSGCNGAREIAWRGWLWVWSANLFFLGASYAVKAGWTGNLYVRKLGPNWEYTLGNWWSGMLLLAFAALTAMSARNTRPGSKPWWALTCLACLGLGLSLDELGSLHERVSNLGPLHEKWNLLPFAVLTAVALSGSLWVLWRKGLGDGRIILTLLLGFLFLGMVEPLEVIEHAYPWPTVLEPFGSVLEEAIELLGSTLMLVAAVGLNRRIASSDQWRRGTGLAGLAAVGLFPLLAVIPLIALRESLQTDVLALHKRGDFGATPAVMIFMLIGWACVLRALDARNARGPWLAIAGVSVLLSIEMGCNLIAWIYSNQSVHSPAAAWWVQIPLVLVGYVLLRLITRPATPARGSSPGSAA
jgi:hypothetical protein